MPLQTSKPMVGLWKGPQISVNRVDVEIEFSGKLRLERLCLQFEYDIAM
jgi:hypothetical protein